MTLVWGIREEGPAETCKRARWLFDQFTERKTQVVLPSVVLSEYLTKVRPDERERVINEFNERFLIVPFDTPSAAMAADLYLQGAQMRTKGEAGGRAILRADAMIIATAKTYGAGTFYTGDADCRELASKVMRASELPEPDTDLFGNFVSGR